MGENTPGSNLGGTEPNNGKDPQFYDIDDLGHLGGKKKKIKKILPENEIKHNKMKLIAVLD